MGEEGRGGEKGREESEEEEEREGPVLFFSGLPAASPQLTLYLGFV